VAVNPASGPARSPPRPRPPRPQATRAPRPAARGPGDRARENRSPPRTRALRRRPRSTVRCARASVPRQEPERVQTLVGQIERLLQRHRLAGRARMRELVAVAAIAEADDPDLLRGLARSTQRLKGAGRPAVGRGGPRRPGGKGGPRRPGGKGGPRRPRGKGGPRRPGGRRGRSGQRRSGRSRPRSVGDLRGWSRSAATAGGACDRVSNRLPQAAAVDSRDQRRERAQDERGQQHEARPLDCRLATFRGHMATVRRAGARVGALRNKFVPDGSRRRTRPPSAICSIPSRPERNGVARASLDNLPNVPGGDQIGSLSPPSSQNLPSLAGEGTVRELSTQSGRRRPPPPRAQPEGRGGMPSGGTRARPRCPRFGLPPRRCISGWLRLGLSGPASHLVIRPSARTLPSEGLKPALTRPEARLPHSAPTPTTAPRSALSRAASITSKPAIASESGTGGGASSWIAATIPS
jgi:hypothetical protein